MYSYQLVLVAAAVERSVAHMRNGTGAPRKCWLLGLPGLTGPFSECLKVSFV